MSVTKRTIVAFWHFHCPDCGLGDGEAGYHASVDAVWCEVCLEEGRHVRLNRWPVDESGLPASSVPGGRT